MGCVLLCFFVSKHFLLTNDVTNTHLLISNQITTYLFSIMALLRVLCERPLMAYVFCAFIFRRMCISEWWDDG
jgi:hypothetical protein